jgi:hypothetical protein
VTSRHEVQQHYVVVSHDAHYTFSDNGAIEELVCEISLRAITPGVRLYHCGFGYPSDQRPGVLSIEQILGATAADIRESPTGAIAVYLLLDRALHPADPEPYVLSFQVTIRSERPSGPRLRYFADAGNEQLRLRADFHALAAPALLWWFAAADVVDAEHFLPAHQLKATAGDRLSYERTFDRLVPGWCYGFAWHE